MSDIKKQIIDTLKKATDSASPVVGSRKYSTHTDNIRGIDSIGSSIAMPEIETPGFCFITRPRCNLSTSSIRQDRILSMLDTLDRDSVALAIRSMLDTDLDIYHPSISTNGGPKYIDLENPFIPILTNRLDTLSGWPDPVLEVETSDAGFYGESITYPKGFDQLSKAYTLTGTFADIQGGFIMSLFLIWSRYLERITRGASSQYPRDIEDRRQGWTSSIYRFTLDPSKRFITKWAKATGCFPQSNNLGKYFNFDRNASNLEVNKDVTIPFSVGGNVSYLEPIILAEFNTVVERFCPNIRNMTIASTSASKVENNYRCVPWIDLESGSNELQWRYLSENSWINRDNR